MYYTLFVTNRTLTTWFVSFLHKNITLFPKILYFEAGIEKKVNPPWSHVIQIPKCSYSLHRRARIELTLFLADPDNFFPTNFCERLATATSYGRQNGIRWQHTTFRQHPGKSGGSTGQLAGNPMILIVTLQLVFINNNRTRRAAGGRKKRRCGWGG